MTKPWLLGVQGDQVMPLIESDAKNIRVVAGPGTGKTFGLVRRVLRVVHPEGMGVPGSEVLVVAFNRVIANDLRDEIRGALADLEPDCEPVVQTIHGLSLWKLGDDLRLLLPDERRAMLYDIRVDVPNLKGLYPTINKVEQALRDHEARINDAPILWQAVRRWLVRHKSELIIQVPERLLERLRAGDFSSERFRHVFVDEFQDLTPAEQQLVLRLRQSGGSFVALGDPRQSIYAFRGNDREGLGKLDSHLLGGAEPISDIPMTICMRCPKGVVRAANRLMSLAEPDAMEPGSTGPSVVHVVTWDRKEQEASGMARAVVDNVRKHPDDRHLVMVTRRQFGRYFREAVAKIADDVPVHLSFTEAVLDELSVREAFAFYCLLADPDPSVWRSWLGMPINRSGQRAQNTERNAQAYLKFLTDSGDEITDSGVRRLASSTGRMGPGGQALRSRALRFVDLRDAFDWDGSASGLIDSVLANGKRFGVDASVGLAAMEDLQSLRIKAAELLAECPEDQPEDSKSRRVARELRHHIATKEPFVSGNDPGITVATLWGAKGVTAEHVYVLGLFDEAMPGTRSNSYPGNDLDFLEEQRRLFYVSITRTKKTLVLSRPLRMKRSDARPLRLTLKAARSGWWSNLTACQFFSDIREVLPDAVDGNSWKGCSS